MVLVLNVVAITKRKYEETSDLIVFIRISEWRLSSETLLLQKCYSALLNIYEIPRFRVDVAESTATKKSWQRYVVSISARAIATDKNITTNI